MDSPPPFASPALRLVRRNRWLLALAVAAPIVAIVAPLLVDVASHLELTLLGIVIAYRAFHANVWPRITRLPVHADASGLRLGELFVPRAELRDGVVLPSHHPPRVRLHRRWSLPFEIELASADQGRALLHALGLGASQKVMVFRALSRAVARKRNGALVLAIFFVFYAAVTSWVNSRGPDAHGAPEIVATLGILALAVVFLLPSRLSVGADGVALRWFGRERFLAYGDILDVHRYGRERQIGGGLRFAGVTLELRSGETVAIPIAQAKANEEDSSIVEERIREALDAHRRGGLAADSAFLRRGPREVSEWVAALRALGAGANADMRTAPLPPERLFRVVEDPASGSADRAAAAIALGSDLDDAGRTRLRSAAAGVAGPRLRAALEAAASQAEQAALEAALAEVEQEEATQRAERAHRARKPANMR